MNAYLQEERQRCQQLASALGREQQGSETRAVEVERLSALAQQSTEDVMAAREAAAAERSRSEGLARERAALQGKVRLRSWEACWIGGGAGLTAFLPVRVKPRHASPHHPAIFFLRWRRCRTRCPAWRLLTTCCCA